MSNTQANTQVTAKDDTQYGYAGNGTHVGSGFDVQIKRESRNFALVNITSPNGDEDLLAVLDVEPSQDLQLLAIEIGNNHGEIDGFDSESEEWDELAERWDAIAVSR